MANYLFLHCIYQVKSSRNCTHRNCDSMKNCSDLGAMERVQVRLLCARRGLSEVNGLKFVEEMMKATALSCHCMSLSVRSWSKFLALIMVKLRF